MGFFFRQLQKFFQVPGNGLSLTVRVRCQIDCIRLGGGCFQFFDQGLLAPDWKKLRRKIML